MLNLRLKRTHFSPTSVDQLRDVDADSWINGMPAGFWYFVGQPFTRCVWSQTSATERKWRYRVDVSACRILLVRDAIDAHAAMLTWKLPEFPERDGDDFESLVMLKSGHPDWAKLARDFDGVELPVNARAHRPKHWHSWFDCPSGCIWNASKLKITLIEQPASSAE